MARGPAFPRREARKETVTVTLRQVRPKSIAVTDGDLVDWTNPETGEITERERWEFLPRFYVEIEGVADMTDTDALEGLIGKEISVTASEKLLAEKGFL